DSLIFGIGVDSLSRDTIRADTFCHVVSTDSALNSFAVVSFDRYLVLKYRADTTISPKAETTIVYRLDSLAPPPYEVRRTTEMQKNIRLRAVRHLLLQKQGSSFSLQRMTGFCCLLPNSDSAPVLRSLVLTHEAGTDTITLMPGPKNLGIYRLMHRDSLLVVRRGSSLGITVTVEPPELPQDQYYFLARVENQRLVLARGTSMSEPTYVQFPRAGLKALTIEVIPQSNLFYPAQSFTTSIWSLPVRVVE
ncbi:MAG: hypothetical protein ABIK62_00240, partial [candidate division WOR-3 bacterium]